MMGQDWHAFDVGRGWEVRELPEGGFEARRVDDGSVIWKLTPTEFDQWRAEGINPRELT